MANLCGVAGCNRPASTNASYCSTHNGRRARHGHPLGRGLSRDLFVYYLRTHQALHAHRHSHDGLKIACDELDANMLRWAHMDAAGEVLRAHERELGRLGSCGIDGLDVVEAVSAVLLFDAERPNGIRDQRALHFAVARFVRSLAPVPGASFGAKLAVPLGHYLIERYSPLFAVVLRRFDEERAYEEQRRERMATPMPFVPA